MSVSIEEQVEELVKGILNRENIKYFHKTESVNSEIDKALKESISKQGQFGGNYPDMKLLIKDLPIMIEIKGGFDKLIKFNIKTHSVDLSSFINIKSYAVNGAIHYANNIVSNSNYKECLAVGITGWYPPSTKQIQIAIAVYRVERDNFAQHIKEINTIDDFTKYLKGL